MSRRATHITLNDVPLQELRLRPEYRSDRAVLADEFFRPCLERSLRYDRAVGYFQSSSLVVVADGLVPFLAGGGTLRLIASPRLSKEDAMAILSGYDAREVVDACVAEAVTELETLPDAEKKRLELLTWLVANERLDIRLAVVVGEGSVGMYHEKLGLFTDEEGHRVAFSGSANESFGGLVANFECLDVFRSWVEAERPRVDAKADAFERLWNSETDGVRVFEFPVAARARLIELAPEERPTEIPRFEVTDEVTLFGFPVLPSWFHVRDYQREAVSRWLKAGGRGILAMATGTGKTLTAMAAVVQVARQARKQGRPLLVVIVAPQKHLVTQWAETVRAFGVDPLLCFESSTQWTRHADAMRSALAGARAPFGLWITTNATFVTEAFQARLNDLGAGLLFIADEVHNLGSDRARGMLPEHAQFRLGLSATPERHLDITGTEAVFSYFGEAVFSLPIEDAITRGILTPYRYEPVVVELEDEELESYVGLTEQIVRALEIGGDIVGDDPPPHLQQLLFKRARLIGGARAKLGALHAHMANHTSDAFSLVYCSESAVNGTTTRQLDAVVELLGHRMGMRVAPYTFDTETAQRRRALELFEEGTLNALIAIRCLDEGVDIPATRRAFILASSANPRQYVQRRGRVLRRFPGKDGADIYDFIAVPPEGALPERYFDVERRLVERELVRVVEFAGHAENGATALAELLPLQRRYELLHLG